MSQAQRVTLRRAYQIHVPKKYTEDKRHDRLELVNALKAVGKTISVWCDLLNIVTCHEYTDYCVLCAGGTATSNGTPASSLTTT